MRKKKVFIKGIMSGGEAIHFVSNINGVKNSADLWFGLDSGLTLFQNVEKILTGLEEANNVTTVNKISDTDWEVEYNEHKVEESQNLIQVQLTVEDFIQKSIDGEIFELCGNRYFYDKSFGDSPFRFLSEKREESIALVRWHVFNGKNAFLMLS